MMLKKTLLVFVLFWFGVAGLGIINVDPDSGKCGCCPKPCCCLCKEKEMPECENKLELCMLQDSSDSIKEPFDWMASKQFLIDVLDQFTNVQAKTAHISYSSTANLTWNLNSAIGMDKNMAQEVLQQLAKWESLQTNPVAAFQLMMSDVFNGLDDLTVENVALVVTDGKATLDKDMLPGVIGVVHPKVKVVVIGVGDDVNVPELQLMASGPGNDNVLLVPSNAELKDFVADAVTELCPDPVNVTEECFCCCPPPDPYPDHHHHYGGHFGHQYGGHYGYQYGGPYTPRMNYGGYCGCHDHHHKMKRRRH